METKKVRVPTATCLLDLTIQQIDEIMNTTLNKGEEVIEEGNKFVSYAVATDSYETIQKAYYKIKFLHPAADHVMCAFVVPKEDLFAVDYCDDGEHGGGRALMGFLQQHELSAKVIFTVRYFSGKKIGPKRFECIVRSAVSAMRMCAHLHLTEEADDTMLKLPHSQSSQTTMKQSYEQNRGRGTTRQMRPIRGNRSSTPNQAVRGARPSYSGVARSKSMQRGTNGRRAFQQRRPYQSYPRQRGSNRIGGDKRKYISGERVAAPLNKRRYGQNIPDEETDVSSVMSEGPPKEDWPTGDQSGFESVY